MSYKKNILFTASVLSIGLFSLIFVYPKVTKALEGQAEIRNEKLQQAEDADPPTVSIEIQPSFYVSPGAEATAFAQTSNFGGRGTATDFFYNWCFDDIPINTFITGSSDEFDQNEDGSYTIKNQYGELKGGRGACDIQNIYNLNYIATDVLDMDGAPDARKYNDQYYITPLIPKDENKYVGQYRNIIYNKDISVQASEAGAEDPAEGIKKARELSTKYANQILTAQKNPKDKDAQETFDKQFTTVESTYDIDKHNNLKGYFLRQAARSSEFLKKNIKDSLAFERTVSADDDIDEDGMADSWELLYFGKYAGQEKKVQPPIAKRFTLFAPYIGFAAGGNWPVKENQKYGSIDIGAKTPREMYYNFLVSVNPLEDPDGDGVHVNDILNNCNYDFQNDYPDKSPDSPWSKVLEYETCMIRPNNTLFPIITEGWQVGAPNFKSTAQNNTIEVVSGGGIFANFMEYIAGTDPQKSDTDGDGIPDGADYLGLKQQTVPVVFNKKAGENIDVQVHVVGDSIRGSQVRGTDAADSPSRNVSRWWVESADDQKSLRIGGGLPIPVRLMYTPYPVTMKSKGSGNSAGNPIIVTAGATSTDETTVPLFYQWYLDNIPLPAPKAELVGPFAFAGAFLEKGSAELAKDGDVFAPSGMNKKNLEFDVDDGATIWSKLNPGKELGVCTSRTIGVDLIDDKTGTTTHGEVKVPIGSMVTLTDKLVTNIDPSQDTTLQAFNLNDPTAINEIKSDHLQELLVDEAKNADSIDQILSIDKGEFKANTDNFVDPDKGYRVGDIVHVQAKLDDLEGDLSKANRDSNGNLTSGGSNNCPIDIQEKLVYNWYFDDLLQEEKSGIDKSGIQVAMTSEGGDLRQASDEGSHYLRLEVVNSETGELFARDIKELRVVRPYVDVRVDGAQLVSTGGDSEDVAISKYKVVPGSEVTLFVTPQYFRPLPDGATDGLGYNYSWSRNGVVDEAASRRIQGTSPSPGSYTFTVSPDEGEIDEIIFEVSTEGDVSGDYDNVLQQTASQTMQFSSAFEPEYAEQSNTEYVSGSISKFVPEHYKNVFNVTFALGGFALLAGIVFMMYKGKPEAKK